MSSQPQQPERDDPEKRIKRGCLGMAILIIAGTWVLILQTGNLAWSLLLILAVLLLLARRYLV